MKIDRINYKKIFPLGSYVNETIGMEAELDAGDDAAECLVKLKKAVEELHKTTNPQLQFESEFMPTIAVTKIESQEQLSPEQAIIRDIGTCKDLKILETYKFIAKKSQQLQDAYNQKLNELTNA